LKVRHENLSYGIGNFIDNFWRDAVAQITERDIVWRGFGAPRRKAALILRMVNSRF